jgi:adenosine deaminase
MAGEPHTFENFLSKFVTLREFFCSPEVISRITYEAVEDAARDNVRYLELRFTPVALSRVQGFPLGEVMDWVIAAARKGDQEANIITRLIASVNRHEQVALAEKVIDLAIERRDAGIVGLDLAGSEAEFPAEPFLGVFKEAQQAGMQLTIHAGEWGGAENVRQAIEDFGSRRVGHGVRVMEDPAVLAVAREHSTVFEVCVTSNYQSGVVTSLQEHPLSQMIANGLQTTLNTDDPAISQIRLSDEYQLVCEELGVSRREVTGQILAAVRASFLEEDIKEELFRSLRHEIKTSGLSQ